MVWETKPIREINPDLPRTPECIISRCIQLNPDERFQPCDKLKRALKRDRIFPSKKKKLYDRIFGKAPKKQKSNSTVERIIVYLVAWMMKNSIFVFRSIY